MCSLNIECVLLLQESSDAKHTAPTAAKGQASSPCRAAAGGGGGGGGGGGCAPSDAFVAHTRHTTLACRGLYPVLLRQGPRRA